MAARLLCVAAALLGLARAQHDDLGGEADAADAHAPAPVALALPSSAPAPFDSRLGFLLDPRTARSRHRPDVYGAAAAAARAAELAAMEKLRRGALPTGAASAAAAALPSSGLSAAAGGSVAASGAAAGSAVAAALAAAEVAAADEAAYASLGNAPLVRRFSQALHAQQFPPKSECRSRRLLAIQFSPKSFEGIGSILKLIMLALAEAAHSNRTLVWGLDLPYNFEHTRVLWQQERDRHGAFDLVAAAEAERRGASVSAAAREGNLKALAWGKSRDEYEDDDEEFYDDENGEGEEGEYEEEYEDEDDEEEEDEASTSFSVGGITLECGEGWRDHGGGAFNCFFQPISSCSLADATLAEVLELGTDGFRDEARLRIAESARRGLSAYHLPNVDALPIFAAALAGAQGQVVGATGTGQRRGPRNGPGGGASSGSSTSAAAATTTRFVHEWAASLAAFAFRLKPRLQAQLERRRIATWPTQAGGTAQCLCGSELEAGSTDAPRSRSANASASAVPSVWGVHVRHGDVASLVDVYGNRRSYPFSDFFLALRQRAVYVTSDDPDTASFVKGACAAWSASAFSHGGAAAVAAMPCVFVAEPSERFRSVDGSHTVAADGGCVRDVCALPPERVLAIRAAHAKADSEAPAGPPALSSGTGRKAKHSGGVVMLTGLTTRGGNSGDDLVGVGRGAGSGVKTLLASSSISNADAASTAAAPVVGSGTTITGRATRIVRTLTEAVEDLYFLSFADAFVAQGTSHFSTVGVLLSWARTGAFGRDASVHFLDSEHLISGAVQPGFIHGSLNGTSALAPSRYHERWDMYTKRFAEGKSGQRPAEVRFYDYADGKASSQQQLPSPLKPASAPQAPPELEIDAETGEVRVAARPKAPPPAPSPFPAALARGGASAAAATVLPTPPLPRPMPLPRGFTAENMSFRLRLRGLLPVLPTEVFKVEAKRWLGGAAGAAAGSGAPYAAQWAKSWDNPLQVWAGECPLPAPLPTPGPRTGGGAAALPGSGAAVSSRATLSVEARKAWIIENINYGADQSELHPNQAMRCWRTARRALAELEDEEARGDGGAAQRAAGGTTLFDLADVVEGNMRATRNDKMFPYSMGEASVRRMLLINLGVDADKMK